MRQKSAPWAPDTPHSSLLPGVMVQSWQRTLMRGSGSRTPTSPPSGLSRAIVVVGAEAGVSGAGVRQAGADFARCSDRRWRDRRTPPPASGGHWRPVRAQLEQTHGSPMGQSPLEWQPGTQVVCARSQIWPMLQSRSLLQPEPVTHSPTVVSQKPWLLQSALVTQPTLTWQKPLGLQITGTPASCGQAALLLQRQRPALECRSSRSESSDGTLAVVGAVLDNLVPALLRGRGRQDRPGEGSERRHQGTASCWVDWKLVHDSGAQEVGVAGRSCSRSVGPGRCR